MRLEQSIGDLVSKVDRHGLRSCVRVSVVVSDALLGVAWARVSVMWRVECPRLGDERLSGKKVSGGTTGAGKKLSKPPKSGRKSNSGSDIGRALRSAYDDTVREPVPDEFMDLLGKLG